MNGPVARRDGVALWRQIADDLRQSASRGLLGVGEKLPTEFELAARYGVNRHTVRSAIAVLVEEGMLRSEQGRGTFVVGRKRLTYPLARRTRFSAALEGQAATFATNLIDSDTRTADAEIAGALDMEPDAALAWLRVAGSADGQPISLADHWLPLARFDGIAEIFGRTGSMTAALAHFGVSDYTRRSSTVTAALVAEDDLRLMRLAPGALVLVVTAVNIDAGGVPIQFSRTRFAADRVELSIVSEMEAQQPADADG